jgi:hypothetical protein
MRRRFIRSIAYLIRCEDCNQPFQAADLVFERTKLHPLQLYDSVEMPDLVFLEGKAHLDVGQ